jgi:hypothetical protein
MMRGLKGWIEVKRFTCELLQRHASCIALKEVFCPLYSKQELP